MNELQSRKRNVAFFVWFAATAAFFLLLLVLPLVPPSIRPPKPVYMCLVPGAFIIPLIFWFKGFYHWAKGKGFPSALALVGVLGFPIALVVMALVRDRNAPTPPNAESSKRCGNCGAPYQLNDYSPVACQVLCSVCKSELPRN